MRKINLLCAAVVLSVASGASAQTTFTEGFTKATGDCFAKCEADASSTTVAAPAAVPAKAAAPAKRRAATRKRASASATANVDLSDLERRVKELEDWREKHGDSDGLAALIATLKTEISQEIEASAKTLRGEDAGLLGTINGNQMIAAERYNELKARIEGIEAKAEAPFGNSVGLDVGLIAFTSGKGFDFTSAFVGGRLHIGLNREFYAYAAPSLLIAGGDQPFSAMIGGGIGYRLFGDGQLAGAMTFGMQMVAMELDEELNASAIAYLGAIGFDFRLPENFRAGGTVLLGPAFDGEGDPRISGGGLVTLGHDF